MFPGLTELLDATLNKYTAIAMTVIDLVFTTDQRQLQVQPQKTSFRWRWLCVLKLEHTRSCFDEFGRLGTGLKFSVHSF